MIHLVHIEPLENRYTSHWLNYLGPQIERNVGVEVNEILGDTQDHNNGSGQFLDFTSTVIWKSEQISKIARMFKLGQVNRGDVFVFTDAWNPAVHFVRYMSDLQGIPVKIVGIWHAGSYDPADLLGQRFENKAWSYKEEAAMYECYDLNVFATNFHRCLFMSKIEATDEKSVVCGFPMEYMDQIIPIKEDNVPRERIVIFPHRKSPEKRIQDFYRLEESVNELCKELGEEPFEFIVCQDVCSNKEQYHELLRRASIAVSFSEQETLGISMIEAYRSGCNVIVPDRLSYAEMYPAPTRYDEITIDPELVLLAHDRDRKNSLIHARLISERFFSGKEFYKRLKKLHS